MKRIEKHQIWVAVLKTLHQSEKLNRVSEGAEVLYRRLLEQVDDNGNYFASPGLILGYVFAHRLDQKQVSLDDIVSRLSEIAREHLVIIYGDGKYLHIANHYTRFRKDRATNDVRFPLYDEHVTPTERARDGHGTGTIHIDKTRQDQIRQDQKCPSTDGLALAKHLRDRIAGNFENAAISKLSGAELESRLQKWGLEIDKIMRLDHRTPVGIKAAIDFAHHDNIPRGTNKFCWARQVLGPSNLRNESLWVQMEKPTTFDKDLGEKYAELIAKESRSDK